MKNKLLDYFIIPSRYHKYPIPVPKVVYTHQTLKKLSNKQCPKKIITWLMKKKGSDKRVFIFVPHIACGLQLENILKPLINCLFVYAEMKERKNIINKFRENELQFIITTTILERGVTVPNVDVCIICGDNQIFDERAIIQIVGRAGRDKKYPTSDVVVFTDFNTSCIKKAIKEIKNMNRTF